MNAPLNRLSRLVFASLPLCLLLASGPVRGQDSDSDPPKRPGFFQRLGNSIFKGTHKLERSDSVDPTTGGHGREDGTLPPGSTNRKTTTTTTTRRQTTTPPATIDAASNPAPAYPSSAATPASTAGDPDTARRLKPKHNPVSKDDEPAPKTVSNKKEKGAEKDSATAKDKNDVASKDATAQNSDKDKAAADKDEYPVGTRGHTAGFVKSPFPPNNELDARGMISGTLAKDPTTGKIFRVP